MAPLGGIVEGLALLVTIGLVLRAVVAYRRNPDEPYDRVVPDWERYLTAAVGVPVMLVGFSTILGGPVTVPYDPRMLMLVGGALSAYPDFIPSESVFR